MCRSTFGEVDYGDGNGGAGNRSLHIIGGIVNCEVVLYQVFQTGGTGIALTDGVGGD